jgi:site-specific DNA recombinase
MDVFTYQRLSQDRYGTSPNCAIQERENREYAEAHGDTVAGSFSDNDKSISKEGRKRTKPRDGYPAMLDAIAAHGQPCKIIITEMPRLYRQLEELIDLFHFAERTQLQRIETTEGLYYDLSTGEGIHAAVMAVSASALESRRLSDRLKRKRRAMAESGRPNGGTRPYGYDAQGMKVVEDEAAVLRESVERILNGWPIRSIIRDLNERGIPTANGNLWNQHRFRMIVTSGRIAGIREHLGAEYPAQWPAIITPETRQRVTAKLQSAERFKGVEKKGVRSYLLTGYIFCGLCGKQLVAGGGEYGTRGYNGRRYRCKKNSTYGLKYGCGQISRLAEPVELVVTEAVIKRYSSPEFAAALAETSEPTEDADFTRLAKEDAQHKDRLRQVEEAFTGGRIDIDTMLRLKGDIERQLEKVRSQMAKHETGRLMLTLPNDGSLYEAWDAADIDQRRQLVSLLVERVTLQPSRPGSRLWTHERSGKQYVFEPSAIQIAWRV